MLLHLLIFLLFTTNTFKKISYLPPHKQEKKITLNLKQISIPQPKPIVKESKPVVKKEPPVPIKPIEEKIEKPTPKPEAPKRKIVTETKKSFAIKSSEENNITKPQPKPTEETQKKKIVKKEPKQEKKTKKMVQKTQPKPKPKRSKDSLANALMGSGTSLYPKRYTPSADVKEAQAQRMIQQHYGSEFETFSPAQKKFIKENLVTIHQITQRTLTLNGYPEIAARTGQQGMNVVSFYLHPNGDISDLRLKRQIGYEALDSNTLEVIRIAYKDYPLPNKKTKIIFHVMYSLY